MSQRRNSEDEIESSVELQVVLVDKSFVKAAVDSSDVKLTRITIEAKPSEKIASVKATLRRITDRTVLSLYYRGVRCTPSRSVDYYMGLGKHGLWQGRLAEDIRPGQAKLALEILNDAKKIILMVPTSTSVVSLKDIIHHRLGYPPEEQHVMMNNKALNSTTTLDHWAKKSSASLTLLYETETDVDVSTKYVQFSRHLVEPVHRSKRSEELMHCEIVSGLNIEGVCCTPSCRAFGRNAIYTLGQEVFDMCIDAALCPCCKNQMHIANAGFHDCAWRIQGVKKSGEHLQSIKTIARETGDEYVRCDPSKCRTPGKWHRLMLQAIPLKCSRQCVVCRSRIETDDCMTSLCGEYLHPACYQAWREVDLRCPSCLQQLQT